MGSTAAAQTIADLPSRFNAAEDLLADNLVRHPDKTAIIDQTENPPEG